MMLLNHPRRHYSHQKFCQNHLKKDIGASHHLKECEKHHLVHHLLKRINLSHYFHDQSYKKDVLSIKQHQNIFLSFQDDSRYDCRRSVKIGNKLKEEAVQNKAKMCKKVLSLKKLNSRQLLQKNEKLRGQKLVQSKNDMFGQPPFKISKKSTDYSSQQSLTRSLRSQNQKIKQACQLQLKKLANLQKQILMEEKAHQLRKQLYLQNIEKLKEIAEIEILQVAELQSRLEEGLNNLNGEQIDNLSIQSH